MPLGGLFKKKLSRNVFFHIPKTGGSTLIGALKEGYHLNDNTPTHVTKKIENLQIFHVDFNDQTRRFEGRNTIKKIEKYPESNFFTIFRDPALRLMSEFNFQFYVLNGKNKNPSAAILQKLNFKPQSFSDYIRFPEVQNYQAKFLLGFPLADPKFIEESDFMKLIGFLSNSNMYFGITEDYIGFLDFFRSFSGMSIPQKLIWRKKTPKQLKSIISKEDLDFIKKSNQFDYKLHAFANEKIKNYSVKENVKHKFIDPNTFTV